MWSFTALLRIAKTWTLNTIYLIVYVVTYGKKTIHEGTFIKFWNVYVNWNIDHKGHPLKYVTPSSEEEICDVVRSAKKLRVAGGGHSFNRGPFADVILNLDNYKKIHIDKHTDPKHPKVQAQAGIRLRDFISQIEHEELDLPTLGSTNAQSLGGLVASDLHGTSHDLPTYLSDNILWIKIVDDDGVVHKLEGEDLYGVTGAIGALGVVIELCMKCRKSFRLSKKIEVVDIQYVYSNIKTLLKNHDHLSFYFIGGTTLKSCRMNTWNETDLKESSLYKLRHFMQEIFDLFLLWLVLGIGRVTQSLDKFGYHTQIT